MKSICCEKPVCSLIGAFSLLCLCLGCSEGNDLPPVYPAGGTVLLNGEPVEGATVVFRESTGKGRPATAVTDAQGEFQLSTYGKNDGAVAGTHIVTVTKNISEGGSDEQLSMEEAESATSNDEPEVRSEIPAQYTNPKQSPLEYEVTESGENQFKIELD